MPNRYTFAASQSGIKEYYPVIWYFKELTIEKNRKKQYLLQFEAVDYICELWINNQFGYKHVGWHTPFEVNSTDYLTEKTYE